MGRFWSMLCLGLKTGLYANISFYFLGVFVALINGHIRAASVILTLSIVHSITLLTYEEEPMFHRNSIQKSAAANFGWPTTLLRTIAIAIIAFVVISSASANFVFAEDTNSNSRRNVSLNSMEQYVYDAIMKDIKEIAAGNKASSELTVNLMPKISKTTFTASELGLGILGTGGKFSNEAKSAVERRCIGSLDTDKVLTALLMDAPYELYWFDKTSECIQSVNSGFSGSVSGSTITNIILTTAEVKFSMPVSADYSASGRMNTYSINTSETKAAAAIAKKAQSIVSAAASKSDYAKLVHYKNEVSSLATYNTSVASDPSLSSRYGDPYQLIYVFDGDQSTGVTCEGYCKAFKYLCDLTKFNNSSIRCYMVSGRMAGGTGAGPHMWNLVHMEDGKNYLVDVTNCDTGTVGYPSQLFLVGDPNGVSTNYKKRTSNGDVSFVYGSDMFEIYTTAELMIANHDYMPVSDSGSGTTSSVNWKRLAGNGRYDTMKAIVDEGFVRTGGTVVIATGTGFKDALAASGLAGLDDAPVVLTDGKSLSKQARDILVRLKPSKVYVAGGKAVVEDGVLTQIRTATGVTPKRIAGANSSATSAQLALEGRGRWKESTAIIATNKSFKDALSVAPIAYAKGYPILLADNGQSLSDAVINALKTIGIKNAIIVGGMGAVNTNVENQLRNAGVAIKVRLAGTNGVKTSAAIATWGIQNGLSANKMGVATSQNYPDALAGAALCGFNNSVLVLADDKAWENALFPKAYKSTIKTGYIFGGTSAVGEKTVSQLKANVA